MRLNKSAVFTALAASAAVAGYAALVNQTERDMQREQARSTCVTKSPPNAAIRMTYNPDGTLKCAYTPNPPEIPFGTQSPIPL